MVGRDTRGSGRRCVLFCSLLGMSMVTSCHQGPVQSQSDGCVDTSSQTNTSRTGFQCVHPPEYIVALDEDSSSSCPFVALRGMISQYTFPGPPNFESIENGDWPETRWVFEIPKSEILRLKEEKMVSDEYFSDTDETWCLQLIPPEKESDPIPFVGKPVVVQGYLGTLCFHVHARITIESVRIYSDG